MRTDLVETLFALLGLANAYQILIVKHGRKSCGAPREHGGDAQVELVALVLQEQNDQFRNYRGGNQM